MLSVTERAAANLKEVLDQLDHEPQQVLRIVIKEGKLGLALDAPHDEDQTIEHNGEVVTVIDPVLSDELSGSTLDTTDTPEGRQLTVQRE